MTAINLKSRRELFVDSHILDTLNGTFLKLHEPIPMETVLKADSPWDYPCNFGNQVIFFNDTYLMYYRAKKGENNFLCVATSTDGIHFTKPALQKKAPTTSSAIMRMTITTNLFPSCSLMNVREFPKKNGLKPLFQLL